MGCWIKFGKVWGDRRVHFALAIEIIDWLADFQGWADGGTG